MSKTASRLVTTGQPAADGSAEEVACALIRGAGQMASILRSASAGGARSFAVAMHERCCAAYDAERTGFWEQVLAHLQTVPLKHETPASRVAA